MARQWSLYGIQLSNTTPNGAPLFADVTQYVQALQMSGYRNNEIVRLVATEDVDGEYTGWMETGETEPSMIQLSKIFGISFADGVDACVAAGQGHPIILSLTVK